jgi:hypothetical protein
VGGKTRVVDLANADPTRVARFAARLRDSTGRRVTRAPRPLHTRTPSVQGSWDATVAYDKFELAV